MGRACEKKYFSFFGRACGAMAEQKEAIQKILSDAGVEEPEEIADKIVALFPKTPAKRPRSDVSEINAKRANLSSGG